jgi:hypothetical protein
MLSSRVLCFLSLTIFFNSLVELIVLNIGLAAGILDTRVFSMFVLEALVLTFATTPMTLLYYPPSVRKRVTATGASFSVVGEWRIRRICNDGSHHFCRRE